MVETTLSGECRVDASAGFSINHLATTEWHEKGLRSFLRYRELGVTAATGGRVRAEHIQAKAPVTDGTGWHCHELDFQLAYVLNGYVAFTTEDHGDILLQTGGCAHLPPFTMHDETEFSGDFEVLEITMPADVRTLTARPAEITGVPSSRFVTNHLGSESFQRSEGPRAFLEYRDLGVVDATDRRIQVQVVRTNGPCEESTGWHYHDLEFQFVYVLNGWVRTVLEGYGEFLMEPGDAMTVPPRLKHDVTGFSDEFEVLEINVPADFDTVTC
jgi:quercetin dioxygenase-like cupin family protein